MTKQRTADEPAKVIVGTGRNGRTNKWTTFGRLAAAAIAALALTGLPQAHAQEAAATDAAVDEALLSGAELDTLIAPVALYPDTLLTQIMFAATYPLDVVKAGRFVEASANMTDKERAAAVAQTKWDPSVQALAAGFPDIITRMNTNIDWTEQIGDAVLVQTEDVLNSVQRLRDQAAGTGYLTTNDAQTVVINDDDTISIAPTDPQIVYVPTYDTQTVYTQQAPASDAVFIAEGNDFTDTLATGAVVFGTAMVLNEIFEVDDPWRDYWRGPPAVDWGGGDFDPGPNYTIGGGINIDNSQNNSIGNGNGLGFGDRFPNRPERPDRPERPGIGNGIDGDRFPNRPDRPDWPERPGLGNGGDGNRFPNRPDRPNRPGINNDLLQVDRVRPGQLDRDAVDRLRDRDFRPSADKRAEARAKMEARRAKGEGVAKLPPRGTGDRARPAVDWNKAASAAANRPAGAQRPSKVNRPVAFDRPAKVSRPAVTNRPAKLSKPQNKVELQNRARTQMAKRPKPTTAFKQSGGSRAKAASARGKMSKHRRG